MITVHHLEKSRSHQVLWLLEELELEYELKEYERDHKTMLAPIELRKVHPLGKAPIVTDGDRTGSSSGSTNGERGPALSSVAVLSSCCR